MSLKSWWTTKVDPLLYKLADAKVSAVSSKYVHFVHMGISFAVVAVSTHWLPIWASAGLTQSAAGFIEFWFDAKYEKQPFESNLHDFEDYALGTTFAGILRHAGILHHWLHL